MAQFGGRDPSLTQLELEAEKTRADLAQTVGELHSRITPEAVKADVEEYVRSSGQQLYRNIEQRARENPLQALAIAAGIAFPLFRLASAIPAPVLLVGAGLALAKTNASGAVSAQTSKAGAAAADVLKDAQARMEDVTDSARRGLHDVADGISDSVKQGTSAAREAAESLAKQGASAVAAARTTLSDALGAASETVRDTATNAGANASQFAQQTLQAGQENFTKTIEQHPFVVGGIGLAVGALLAAAFPATRLEGQVLGATSRNLQNQARDVVADARRYADEQGLGVESLREGVKDLGDKFRTMSEAATRSPDARASDGLDVTSSPALQNS